MSDVASTRTPVLETGLGGRVFHRDDQFHATAHGLQVYSSRKHMLKESRAGTHVHGGSIERMQAYP